MKAANPRPPAPIDLLRRRFVATALASLCAPLASCGPADPLVIASHSWIGYQPMFLGRDMVFLGADQAVLLETASSTESLAALAEGRAHGAALTLDEVLQARAAGLPLTIVLIFNVSVGADAVLARPGFDSPAALAGARIGLEPTTLGALMLENLLEAGGLTHSAVETVHFTIDRQVEAWNSGAVDVLITFEPVASALRAEGAQVIFDSRQIPDTIFDVLAVQTPSLSRRQRRALREVIEAHFQALRYLQRNREDASYRLAGRMGVPAQQVLHALRGLELPGPRANRHYLSGDNPRAGEASLRLSRMMADAGLLTERTVDMERLFDTRFLPATDPVGP